MITTFYGETIAELIYASHERQELQSHSISTHRTVCKLKQPKSNVSSVNECDHCETRNQVYGPVKPFIYKRGHKIISLATYDNSDRTDFEEFSVDGEINDYHLLQNCRRIYPAPITNSTIPNISTSSNHDDDFTNARFKEAINILQKYKSNIAIQSQKSLRLSTSSWSPRSHGGSPRVENQLKPDQIQGNPPQRPYTSSWSPRSHGGSPRVENQLKPDQIQGNPPQSIFETKFYSPTPEIRNSLRQSLNRKKKHLSAPIHDTSDINTTTLTATTLITNSSAESDIRQSTYFSQRVPYMIEYNLKGDSSNSVQSNGHVTDIHNDRMINSLHTDTTTLTNVTSINTNIDDSINDHKCDDIILGRHREHHYDISSQKTDKKYYKEKRNHSSRILHEYSPSSNSDSDSSSNSDIEEEDELEKVPILITPKSYPQNDISLSTSSIIQIYREEMKEVESKVNEHFMTSSTSSSSSSSSIQQKDKSYKHYLTKTTFSNDNELKDETNDSNADDDIFSPRTQKVYDYITSVIHNSDYEWDTSFVPLIDTEVNSDTLNSVHKPDSYRFVHEDMIFVDNILHMKEHPDCDYTYVEGEGDDEVDSPIGCFPTSRSRFSDTFSRLSGSFRSSFHGGHLCVLKPLPNTFTATSSSNSVDTTDADILNDQYTALLPYLNPWINSYK